MPTLKERLGEQRAQVSLLKTQVQQCDEKVRPFLQRQLVSEMWHLQTLLEQQLEKLEEQVQQQAGEVVLQPSVQRWRAVYPAINSTAACNPHVSLLCMHSAPGVGQSLSSSGADCLAHFQHPLNSIYTQQQVVEAIACSVTALARASAQIHACLPMISLMICYGVLKP